LIRFLPSIPPRPVLASFLLTNTKGIDGYLFNPKDTIAVGEKLCQQINNPSVRSCSNSIMTTKERRKEGKDKECNTGLQLDTFFSTNKLSNIITLERSEVSNVTVVCMHTFTVYVL